MMLYPPMAELIDKVGSSYALINLVAKRAREISAEAEEQGIPLTKKPVSAAIDEVYTGKLTVHKDADAHTEANRDPQLEKDLEEYVATLSTEPVGDETLAGTVPEIILTDEDMQG
ncbi:MAG: DNA-directed RNA polymerase subunit omega [Oscillospiraceae bacterium]|nr:DNA-directed RNA polymerase subunit omega [Oscillospiraceae bacterium]